MILYRVEYKQNITTYWSEMDEFSSLNQAVECAEKHASEEWFKYYNFRIIKHVSTEEEIWARNTQ